MQATGLEVRQNSLLTSSRKTITVIDWDDYLMEPDHTPTFTQVPFFTHAPLADKFQTITESYTGVQVELPNPFVCAENLAQPYWVATIIHFAGYKALVEFVNFGVDKRYLAWISFCSSIPKPLGFCVENNIPLYPPLKVAKKYPNYLKKLFQEVITNQSLTIPPDLASRIQRVFQEIQETFPVNGLVEVIDKNRMSRTKIGIINAVLGDRIHIKYKNPLKQNCPGDWCSIHSDYIHSIGWSKAIGHDIYDPLEPAELENIETIPLQFPEYPSYIIISEGQLLEARDPWDPFQICQVLVSKVLKHGFFLVHFRRSNKEINKELMICFHISSPYVLPVGFCNRHGIDIVEDYVIKNSPNPYRPNYAPLELRASWPEHKFEIGMKLEVADIRANCYMGPGTIRKVADHLLLVHYDGWEKKNPASTLWISANSPDIFPIGYCELIGLPMDKFPVSSFQDTDSEEDE